MKPARPARLLLTRYTTLPFLLDILLHQSLRFGNPENWEDRNDAYYHKRYREEQNHKNLLALCFTTKPETYHH